MTKNITGQRMRSFLCKGLMLGMAVMVLGATSISFEKPAIAQSKQNVNLNSYKVRKETKITMQEAKEIVAGYFDTTVDEIDFKKAELKWVKKHGPYFLQALILKRGCIVMTNRHYDTAS
jgi:hypothetical protein